MEGVLQNCVEKSKLSVQQWINAQESLLSLEKRNVASVDEIVRGGMDAIQILRGRFSSAVSSAIENANTGSNNLLLSIDNLRELKSGHYHKIVEITESAGKCLLEEYMVDQPSCSTPRKKSFNLPSTASIEELRSPSFEELLQTFWDAKSSKQVDGDAKHILEAAHSLRDSRVLLTAIN